MKLILENWRKFVKETDNDSVPPQLPPEDKKKVEDVIKQLIALQQGVESAASGAEGEVEESRRSRSRKKEAIQRTKEIKALAGLSGIKLADFTPEQREIYNQAKLSFREKEKEEQEIMASTIAHNLTYGDLLKNPMAKKILDKLPSATTAVLLAQAGEYCFQEGQITLMCLMRGFAQNFGMMTERDQDAF